MLGVIRLQPIRPEKKAAAWSLYTTIGHVERYELTVFDVFDVEVLGRIILQYADPADSRCLIIGNKQSRLDMRAFFRYPEKVSLEDYGRMWAIRVIEHQGNRIVVVGKLTSSNPPRTYCGCEHCRTSFNGCPVCANAHMNQPECDMVESYQLKNRQELAALIIIWNSWYDVRNQLPVLDIQQQDFCAEKQNRADEEYRLLQPPCEILFCNLRQTQRNVEGKGEGKRNRNRKDKRTGKEEERTGKEEEHTGKEEKKRRTVKRERERERKRKGYWF